MEEFLKSLLFLNIQASVLIITLLLLKRFIIKSYSGFWQRLLWILAILFMIIPVWKAVPVNSFEPILMPFDNMLSIENENIFQDEFPDDDELKTLENQGFTNNNTNVSFVKITVLMWVLGVMVFLLLSFGSYFIYLLKMKRNSFGIEENEAFESAKAKLNIKRRVRIRKVSVSQSPLLTGCFFPIVYMPDGMININEEELIYLHELTHFKHKDLPIKWVVCVINAINWFNPLMYIAIKNLNEACEIYCDETVTKKMNDEQKRMYMNTILNLVVRK